MEKYINFDRRGRSVSGAIVFFLLGIFALFSVVMVLLSAHAYTSAVQQADENAENRILYHYIANIVRANDQKGAISVQNDGSAKRLVIDLMEEDALLSIYAHEGNLMEMYSLKGDEFHPEYGEIILPIASFEPSMEGNLLSIASVDRDGKEHLVKVSVFAGETGGAQ